MPLPGLANVVAEKAKEFYDSQRKQIAENTPEGVDPNFRQFVDSMPDQFKTFMDDATKAFHDLSERGRTTMGDFQEQVQTAWKQWEDQQRDQRAAADEMTGAFDLKDAAEATSDAESAVAPEEPVTSQAPDAGFDAPAEVGEVPVEEYPGEGKGDVRND
jgi:gas vesicle protein